LFTDDEGQTLCSNCGQKFALVPDKPRTSLELRLYSIDLQLRSLPKMERHLEILNKRTDKLETGHEEARIRGDERRNIAKYLVAAIPVTGAAVALVQKFL